MSYAITGRGGVFGFIGIVGLKKDPVRGPFGVLCCVLCGEFAGQAAGYKTVHYAVGQLAFDPLASQTCLDIGCAAIVSGFPECLYVA